MTYVQYINCHKWKNIICITLWVGATIGLGVALYFGYDQAVNGYHPYCYVMGKLSKLDIIFGILSPTIIFGIIFYELWTVGK